MISMSGEPSHVGFIMDGNRRFAMRLMKQPSLGHNFGARKVEEVLDWCYGLGIKYVTLYALSIENMNRPKSEFNFLMKLFEREFLGVAKNEKIRRLGVRLNVIGRPDLLPESVQMAIKKAVESTKKYSNFFLTLAVAYGGRQEIIEAAAKIARLAHDGQVNPEDITEQVFRKSLYTDGMPDPDLIIRTSGEQRTSGFLLWQGAYSEYYFCGKMWPEFQREDLLAAIEEYKSRQRRFGK